MITFPRRNKWRATDTAAARAEAAKRAQAALQSAAEEADARVAEATKARDEQEQAALATKALAETYAARLQGEVLDATARLREKEEELNALTSRDDWARQLMQQRSAISLLRQQLLEANKEKEAERRMFAEAAGMGFSEGSPWRVGGSGAGCGGSGANVGGEGRGGNNKTRAEKGSSVGPKKGKSKGKGTDKGKGKAQGGYPRISAAKLQRFLEERGREAALNRARINEYERREQATARPWHELEQREEEAKNALRRVKRETAATVAMWEAMVTERDRTILALNDQLAALASRESANGQPRGVTDNGVRRAAAEVLVRQVFELQRKNEELGVRLAAAAAAQAAANSPQRHQQFQGFARGGLGAATANAATAAAAAGSGIGAALAVSSRRVQDLENKLKEARMRTPNMVAELSAQAREAQLEAAQQRERAELLQRRVDELLLQRDAGEARRKLGLSIEEMEAGEAKRGL